MEAFGVYRVTRSSETETEFTRVATMTTRATAAAFAERNGYFIKRADNAADLPVTLTRKR